MHWQKSSNGAKSSQHSPMTIHSSDAGLLAEVVLIASLSLLLLIKPMWSLKKVEYVMSVQQIYLYLASKFKKYHGNPGVF